MDPAHNKTHSDEPRNGPQPPQQQEEALREIEFEFPRADDGAAAGQKQTLQKESGQGQESDMVKAPPQGPRPTDQPEAAAAQDAPLMQEPHPTTTIGKAAKAAVEVMAHDHHAGSDWSLIIQSAAAGTISAMVTLPACQIAANLTQTFADPAMNAGLGVLVSAATYIPTFIAMSLFRSRHQLAEYDASHRTSLIKEKIIHGLKFLGAQEACEYALRYGMHLGLMYLKMEAWSAFMISSVVTGFLGRLATPWFSRIFWRKSTALPPKKGEQSEPAEGQGGG